MEIKNIFGTANLPLVVFVLQGWIAGTRKVPWHFVQSVRVALAGPAVDARPQENGPVNEDVGHERGNPQNARGEHRRRISHR